MNVQLTKQNSFKGYDARPLKGFFMGTNHCGLADEMVKIGEKEGFKIYSAITSDCKAICSEYKKSSNIIFMHLSTWAQDVWTFVNDRVLTQNYNFITEICKHFNFQKNLDFNNHISGGNLFIINKDGNDELLIGKDDVTKMSTTELKKTFQVKNIHVLPQMDYHLDLFIRPLDKKRILVADDQLTLTTLSNGLEKLKTYRKNYSLQTNSEINCAINALEFRLRKFKNEILLNELPQTNKIVIILNNAGFETIRVPGRIYETCCLGKDETFLSHCCNYMNANALINEDGDLVYITNKSNFDKEINLTPDLIKKIGFSFESEFIKSLAPYIKPDKIYFIDGEKHYVSEKMLKSHQGGIHCACAEIPINKEGD